MSKEVIFKSYKNKEEAEQASSWLLIRGIDSRVTNESVEGVIGGNKNLFQVAIDDQDQEKAKRLLNDEKFIQCGMAYLIFESFLLIHGIISILFRQWGLGRNGLGGTFFNGQDAIRHGLYDILFAVFLFFYSYLMNDILSVRKRYQFALSFILFFAYFYINLQPTPTLNDFVNAYHILIGDYNGFGAK